MKKNKGGILGNMSDSGLPNAQFEQKTFRMGSIVVKTQRPDQTIEQAQRGIDNLEKAAKENVFVKHDSEE